MLQPGQVFAERYRIIRHLASGGMGAVFVAEQMATERKVAVKVLWPNVLADSRAVERFELEARIAARVESEHIVQVLDAGFNPETGFPFLVMELLKGAPLEDVVEQHGPFEPHEATSLLRQVALGLTKAHSYVGPDGVARPIVHRDLKPENLFLATRESGEPHVKILDFGLAKVVSETASVSQDVKGTPLYMAYEQATGDEITPQTDIWALGLIAFFLMTGKPYWLSVSKPDASITALFSEILTMPMAPASQRALELQASRTLPAGFDAWLATCIDRDPARRYPTAMAAMEALEAVVRSSSVPGLAPVAQRTSHSPVLGDTALPPTQPSAADAVTAAVNAAPALGTTTGQLSVESSPPPAIPTRSSTPLLLGIGGVALVGAAVAFLVLQSPAPVEPDAGASASAESEVAPAAPQPAVEPAPPPEPPQPEVPEPPRPEPVRVVAAPRPIAAKPAAIKRPKPTKVEPIVEPAKPAVLVTKKPPVSEPPPSAPAPKPVAAPKAPEPPATPKPRVEPRPAPKPTAKPRDPYELL